MGRTGQNGFTLIEMLVALAVFSIAALALLRLDAFAVATTADVDARMIAELVAQNEAALASTDTGAVTRGASTRQVTNAGRQFTVSRTVTPTDDRRLVRIDIAVAPQGERGRASMTIVKRVE